MPIYLYIYLYNVRVDFNKEDKRKEKKYINQNKYIIINT